MDNVFYYTALNRASGFMGRYGRISLLLSQLAMKVRKMDKKDLSFQGARAKVDVLMRLTRSYAKGNYRAIPWKAMASVLGAFVYFINPFDLIPDVAPIIGLTDDVSILVWVYSSIQSEVDKFLLWERSQIPSA
jgi:uncharacterized membrane protein YkvA (DUF1232 family)